MSLILTKTYTDVPCDRGEVLRYLGVKGSDTQTEKLLDECLNEAKGCFTYKVCYSEYDISLTDDTLDLGFAKTKSTALCKILNGCNKIILFAATVGLGIDRLITRYSRVSPSKAVVMQAIGAERIESLCNTFNNEIKAQYTKTIPRFSPGYGDFSIMAQKELFSALDCQRKIGLTLNDSMMMSPSKSVTAIIGIKA